uniref:Secreted protein n=1 Tax=Denticeps clupeoides TaxID=299321 RepID=A0AAY4B4G0_9TELE
PDMKTFCLLAAAILLIKTSSVVITFTRNLLVSDSSGPSECCFDFYTKRIPVSRIQIALHGVLYFRTSCRFCANSLNVYIYSSIYQTPLSRAPYNQ